MTLVFPKYKFVMNRSSKVEPEPEVQDIVTVDGTIDENGYLATNSSISTLTFGNPIPIQSFTLHLSCDFFRYGSTTYYLPCQFLLSEEINSDSGDRPQPQLNFTIANEHMGLYVGTWASGNGYEFNPNLRGNYQYSPIEYTINVTFEDYSDTHYKIALPTGTYNYTRGNLVTPETPVSYNQVGGLVLVPKTCKITGFNLQNFNYDRLRTNINNSYLQIANKTYYAKPTDTIVKNLLDMADNNIKVGYYINNTGTEIRNDMNFYNLKYIPVKANTTYTWGTSESIRYISFMEYDSDKTFVKRTLIGDGQSNPAGTSGQITTGNSTAYILIGSNPFSSKLTLDMIKAINWVFEESVTN